MHGRSNSTPDSVSRHAGALQPPLGAPPDPLLSSEQPEMHRCSDVVSGSRAWHGDEAVTSAVGRVLDAAEHAGCVPRRKGRGWQGHCPVHHDGHPSLTIAEGRDGRVLVKCWAGCGTVDVLRALGLYWRDLFNTSFTRRGRGR